MRAFTLAHGPVVRALEILGGGPPIVFIHGLGCAATVDYPAVVASPALADRHVVLLDLLGFGHSDRPHDAAYTVRAHAQTVAEVVEALAVPAVVLFGHSMGGAVAIEAAAQLGSRVLGLVLSEPNLEPGGGEYSRAIAAIPEARYVALGHAHLVHQSRLGGNTAWADTLRLASPRAVHHSAVSLIAGSSPSWHVQLLGLPVPRTVLFGAVSLPDADHQRLPAGGVRVDVVPGAGHSMAHEAPAALAACVARALEAGA
jgi:pimeloyl-ACP methyl ester carboxylesterase